MKFGTLMILAAIAVMVWSQTALVAAPPADASWQLITAITHAGFAADGQTLNYSRTHLGHALNCLEGTKGANFNAAWGHVCEGQGNGILVDLAAIPAGVPVTLTARHADTLAVAGVKSANLAELKVAARGVAALLQVVLNNLK